MEGVHLSYVPATATNRAEFVVSIERYTAKNNVELFKEVVRQNQETTARAVDLGAKGLGTILSHMK